MDLKARLESDLAVIAQRSAEILSACANEESTKQFLVLPVMYALGYDHTDPHIVQPEYAADFRAQSLDRVDYVVMRGGAPAIAIECKKAGSQLDEHRGQLRAYFAALPSVRLGILTDGLKFEFFVDSEDANVMDEEPFLTLDLLSSGGISRDVISSLSFVRYENFQPVAMCEIAESNLVARRLRTLLMEEIREPSVEFCHLMLQRAGFKNLRRSTIQGRYGSHIRAAIEEALVYPVVESLRKANDPSFTPDAEVSDTVQSIITTDRELAIYRYVCKRLTFLAENEEQFAAIDGIEHKDQKNKFVIYYRNVNKGRLLEFVEGKNGYDRFVVPEFGEITTNNITEIDRPLQNLFASLVRELGPRDSTRLLRQSA